MSSVRLQNASWVATCSLRSAQLVLLWFALVGALGRSSAHGMTPEFLRFCTYEGSPQDDAPTLPDSTSKPVTPAKAITSATTTAPCATGACSTGNCRCECLDACWIVNTRCLPCVPCSGSAQFKPKVYRYHRCARHESSSLEALLAEDGPDWMTVCFIHGNLTSSEFVHQLANQLMCNLPKQLSSGTKLRLIVWSWPSDQNAGHVADDTRQAAARAASDSYYFSRFLTMLNPNQRLEIVGYSFGARITTGALHLLAGSPLGGRHLADQFATSTDLTHPRLRSVLLAAAIDSDWLIPGHWHGSAMGSVERLVSTVNPKDLILNLYPRLEKRGANEAAGAVGLPLGAMGAEAAKVSLTNVRAELGRKHASKEYLSSPLIMSIIKGEIRRFDESPLLSKGTSTTVVK